MSLHYELVEEDFLPRVRDNYEGEGTEELVMFDYWEDYQQESKYEGTNK